MRRWQKTLVSIAATTLALPFLLLLLGYLSLECGELDPCRTGGSMPHAPLALVLLVATAGAYAAFLAMIWRGIPEKQD
ncbi:MAG TPA: hypothetical protein VGW40_15775 [Allosphingosinicella sp.]|nr:hypothetical protein [Allosphingosinicella sp.]